MLGYFVCFSVLLYFFMAIRDSSAGPPPWLMRVIIKILAWGHLFLGVLILIQYREVLFGM